MLNIVPRRVLVEKILKNRTVHVAYLDIGAATDTALNQVGAVRAQVFC